MPSSSSHKSVRFNPAEDIPSLVGKVVLITGGNVGLGKQSALELARHNPSQIWLAARNMSKAKAAVNDIKQEVPNAPITILELDLSSLDSVMTAAKTFLSSSDRLDILMLNAGIVGYPLGLTQQGYEIHFGTNHVGHALLTKLLMPVLLKTMKSHPDADVRVISLSSSDHKTVPTGGIKFDTLKTEAVSLSTFMRYGQSKLGNALFVQGLARKYPQLIVASVHPGAVNTNLTVVLTKQNLILRVARFLSTPFMSTAQEGVKNQLWAAISKDVASGEYYEPVGVAGKASKLVKDYKLAEQLWEWTEDELKDYEV